MDVAQARDRSSTRLAAKEGYSKRPAVAADKPKKKQRHGKEAHTDTSTVSHPQRKQHDYYVGPTSTDSYSHLKAWQYATPTYKSDASDVEDCTSDCSIETDGLGRIVGKVAELRVGDIVVYYDPIYVEGDDRALRWSTIVSIKLLQQEDEDDSDQEFDDDFVHIGLSSYNQVRYSCTKLLVFRHDNSGVLRDVTKGNFIPMKCLDLKEGTMQKGTYCDDTDRMRSILKRRASEMNDKLLSKGLIKSMEGQVDIGVNSPAVAEDERLSEVMEKIIQKIKFNRKDYAAFREYFNEKKGKREERKEKAVDIGSIPESNGNKTSELDCGKI